MKRHFELVLLILLCACSNVAGQQGVILSKRQQLVAQENPCLALSTIENGFEIRAYGEGDGFDQSAAYAEARLNAEAELLREINKLQQLSKKVATSKKSRRIKAGKRSKRDVQPAKLPESTYYASGALYGTRPILVKYHYSESSVVCRICLAMPIENITAFAPIIPQQPSKHWKRAQKKLEKQKRLNRK